MKLSTSNDPRRRISVFLVDDHSILRQGMTAIINEEPDMYVCGEAEGLASALEALKRVKPDIALIDLSIRDGDGLELIKEIRNRYDDIRILVLSMYNESVYAERALRAGASGYIMKEEMAKSVMAGVRGVLRGETYLSERMHEIRARASKEAEVAAGSMRTDSLSDRELQVLRSVGKGLSTREIGEQLFISIKTVETHRENIKHKLGLVSSGELLRYAIEHNRLQC